MCLFKNASDLIKIIKFPNLPDSELRIITGLREANLINFEKIRKPSKYNEPFAAKCKLGWTIFGPDPYLKSKPMTRCKVVCFSDEILDKKVDLLLHESFVERPHDFNQAPSVNDKIVLDKYKKSIKNNGNRYQIQLPFKQNDINLRNNYQYALNRMVKLEQRLKKNNDLKENYFKFMGNLFRSGHTVVVNPSENEELGKVWYQSHFCVNADKKIRVVFDCSAKFKGVCVNDFLYKEPTMRNSLVGVLTRFRTYVHALISDIRILYYQCVVKKVIKIFYDFYGTKIMILLNLL